jgi:hypothetical protein
MEEILDGGGGGGNTRETRHRLWVQFLLRMCQTTQKRPKRCEETEAISVLEPILTLTVCRKSCQPEMLTKIEGEDGLI